MLFLTIVLALLTAAGEDKRLGRVYSNSAHVITMGIEVVNALQCVVVEHSNLKKFG
jgi:hypothetical protein